MGLSEEEVPGPPGNLRRAAQYPQIFRTGRLEPVIRFGGLKEGVEPKRLLAASDRSAVTVSRPTDRPPARQVDPKVGQQMLTSWDGSPMVSNTTTSTSVDEAGRWADLLNLAGAFGLERRNL